MTYLVVGAGEILWDMLPTGRQLGGAPCNFACHIKALGMKTVESYIYSAVGNDQKGEEILAQLKLNNINQQALFTLKGKKTGYVSVSIDSQGQPCYNITEEVAWDYIPDCSLSLPMEINAISFGTLAQRHHISKTHINAFLDKTSEQTLKIFDINLRQSFFDLDLIETSLKKANIFKINNEELKYLCKLLQISGSEANQLETLCCKYQIKLAVLTRGHSGSLLYREGNLSNHHGYSTNVVDTVGAGDAFTAAITLSVLQDFELDHMNDCANQIASYICSQSGATPKLPRALTDLFAKKPT